MSVGKSITRVDAYAKVTGEAKYTADLVPKNCLVAKIVHATIANGLVKSIDLTEAEKVEGVVKIFTCFDVPDWEFPTPGHPWSVETAHQDVSDRKILATRVRLYGDDIAIVVAEDEVAASRAVRLIKVEYEEYPAATDPLKSIELAKSGQMPPLHEGKPDNVLVHSKVKLGDEGYDEYLAHEDDLVTIDKMYHTATVQHCHIELPVCYAYMEADRIVVVSSTQIPHIVRRVIGQALHVDWGKIRVIKPYIGGGFGNKQDMLYEATVAFLTYNLGGRAVMIEPTREETFTNTRVRHSIDFYLKAAAKPDGTLVAKKVDAYSNQGAYASHGHSIVANSVTEIKQIYKQQVYEADAYTVYTNIATGGAMRGYGIPQAAFAAECMADDMALKLGMDPYEFRMKNCVEEGYVDPNSGIPILSYGLKECMKKGHDMVHWDELREKYKNQTGPIRRGIGMAIFTYKTGVYPISLETAACRMVLNQDGSVMLHMGATEIGQGGDTVFSQMAAEATGISVDRIHIVSTQDTDSSPFDLGAYASRQTYVSGKAIAKTGASFKAKILDYASYMLKTDVAQLDISNNMVVDKNSSKELLPLEELALNSFYSLDKSVHIAAEETHHCKENTISTGACFIEVEVDIPVGKIKLLNVTQIHDSGILINPKLAEAQVHGGISMGLGYGMSEELLYNESGKPLNNNLLDYKLPTSLDTPDMTVDFVQLNDPSGPFGNKALGEPPAIPVAAALRNAVLNATGVAFDSLPLHPQRLVEGFKNAGL